MQLSWLFWLMCSLSAYLVGSVPFGLLIGLARGTDIRRHGSRNIGATNAGRVLGKPWGYLCFALDFAKGAAPVLASGQLGGVLGRADANAIEVVAWLGVGIAALLGHVFPVYLRFKGGKGVATGFGAMLATWPGVTLGAAAALVAWLLTLWVTRMVSVSSCVAALTLPVSIVVLRVFGWPGSAEGWGATIAYLGVTGMLTGLVLWKHRANLARVRAGTEPRIGRAGAVRGNR